jgi:AcrR family transcriptional regulator
LPSGVHLNNPRELLFDAAERVLRRDGVSGLTSRAVTTEAAVAKGVMHRHFSDFDTFLAELIVDRVTRFVGPADALYDAAGSGTVVDNVAQALAALFSPLAVAMVALVMTRDGLRARLRQAGAARVPLIAEGSAMVSAYLTAEQGLGRLSATADPATLGPTLIGAVHLLFTNQENGPPVTETLHRVVATVLADGAVPYEAPR